MKRFMKRIALALTGWPDPVRAMVEATKMAETHDFDMVWSAEDYFTGRDGITPLSCFALSTERVRLGTCVISPHMRSPGLIAATASTLDELSNGRMILGLGACIDWAPMFTEDISKIRFLRTMRKTVELVRDLFSKKAVVYEDKALSIRGEPFWWPDGVVRPPRDRIPIYIGARGPKMTRLAAEISDGLILEVGLSVPVVADRIEYFRKCAEEAGRNPDELDIVCLIAFSIDEDESATDATRRFVASRIRKFDLSNAERSGVEAEELSRIKEAFKNGGIDEAANYVSRKSVNAYTASGSAEECIRKMEEYVNVGVKLPTIVSMGRKLNLTIRTGQRYAVGHT